MLCLFKSYLNIQLFLNDSCETWFPCGVIYKKLLQWFPLLCICLECQLFFNSLFIEPKSFLFQTCIQPKSYANPCLGLKSKIKQHIWKIHQGAWSSSWFIIGSLLKGFRHESCAHNSNHDNMKLNQYVYILSSHLCNKKDNVFCLCEDFIPTF